MAPWFRDLATNDLLDLHVVFLREPSAAQQGIGFGHAFNWDTPLREGYKNTVLGLPEGRKSLVRSLGILRHHISSVKPDAVMITGWNEPLLALTYPMLKMMGIPLIVRGESNDLRPRGRLIGLVHRLLLKLVDATVQIGSANRRFYRMNGLAERKIFKGVYFVNTQHMLKMATTHQDHRSTLRDANGFGERDFVFSFVGKHVAFKRPMMLIEAASICRQRGKPVKLLFAGSGELTSALKLRAEELKVDAAFTGFLNQSEMWKAYVPADAFVLPSNNGETWGLVTNEAMLFGLPVIVCDQVGCAEDLVMEGQTGYTFNGQAEDLAKTMIRMSSDPTRATEMGQTGRHRVVERYSMPVATDGLLKAVDYVLRAKDR